MNTDPFEQFTDADLNAELARRTKERLESNAPTPKHKNDRNWDAVAQMCREYVESVWKLGYDHQGDLKQYIFEAAIEAVYGPKIFEQLNARDRAL